MTGTINHYSGEATGKRINKYSFPSNVVPVNYSLAMNKKKNKKNSSLV